MSRDHYVPSLSIRVMPPKPMVNSTGHSILLVRHSACKENILEPLTLEGAMALARSATGPLSPHLTAFVTSLIDKRYAIVSVRAKAWRAAAFDA